MNENESGCKSFEFSQLCVIVDERRSRLRVKKVIMKMKFLK